jgi:hypothetical protein
MSQQLGDGPLEKQYREKMVAVSAAIDEFFNGEKQGNDRETGFVIMVFPFGDHSGRCNYISNGADRRDIVTLMKEMIARFEGQPEIKGQG